MSNLAKVRDRYMRDSLPVRIGGIAANLARIRSFSQDVESCETVRDLIEETKCFIDWVSQEPSITSDASRPLSELTISLARWEDTCRTNWLADGDRLELSRESGEWAQRVIQLSGLQDRARPT